MAGGVQDAWNPERRPNTAAALAVAAIGATFMALAVMGASPTPEPDSPEPGPFVRGVALGLFASDPDWDYAPLVAEIEARGATDVVVIVNATQSNRLTSDIGLRPGISPALETVSRTLRQVREAGMRATLMPVVRFLERAPHEWRGTILPADGVEAWFEAYGAFVLPLAEIAQQEGCERFIVGSELNSLEPFEREWRSLIAEVRRRFGGRVTYSANWDRGAQVGFWDALDELGMTAYFPLLDGPPGRSTAEAIADAWERPRRKIRALAQAVAKPVLFTEVGYPSRSSARAKPWDDSRLAEVDLALQTALYQGFCDAFADEHLLQGYYVWNWFGVGGPRDSGFTPRGKPAAQAMADCFARDWQTPTQTEVP